MQGGLLGDQVLYSVPHCTNVLYCHAHFRNSERLGVGVGYISNQHENDDSLP